jgi:hypothetical protein
VYLLKSKNERLVGRNTRDQRPLKLLDFYRKLACASFKDELIMKLFLVLCFTCTLTVHATEIYKCNDNGKIIFSDQPCSKNAIQTKYKVQPKTKSNYERISEETSAKSIAVSEYYDFIRKNMEQIYIGMPRSEFLGLFPPPTNPLLDGMRPANPAIKYSVAILKVNKTTTAKGIREQWICDLGGRSYYYFVDGILRTIQD